MTPRRDQLEDTDNHGRWLVSYSDFMTLLFGFFVVMYAISSVNEGKYKVLSQSLVQVFPQRELTLEPIQVGEPAQSSAPSPILFDGAPAGASQANGATDHDKPTDRTLEQTATSLQQALAGLLKAGEFSVQGHDQFLEVNLDAGALFASGEATLTPAAARVIDEVVLLLGRLSNPITIEGYTDNVPIATAKFASNWELSAARAAVVARAFASYGIEPERLAAVGYGEQHPIATNATPEGRAANRRVTLLIPRDANVQRGLTAISADRTKPVPLTWLDEGETPASSGAAVEAVRRKEGGVLFTKGSGGGEGVGTDAAPASATTTAGEPPSASPH